MKKVTLLVLAFTSLIFTACQFSENLYISENGSGKMEFTFDASELMVMMGDEMMGESEEAVDSVINFKALFEESKDSIAQLPQAEQEALKALENFSMRMVMNPDTKEMKFDMFTDFAKVSELQNMFDTMSQIQHLEQNSNSGENPFSSLNNSNTKMNYSFDGKVFIRTAEIIDPGLHNKTVDSLAQAMTMFGNSKYRLNYHFPKKIKSVSNEKALFSQDGKSFVLEFDLSDYITNPEALNVEVVLED